MDTTTILNTLNVILVGLNCLITVFVLSRGYEISRQIGAASVAASAQDAYEALVDMREEEMSPEKIDRFYDRLWAAQALQFEQWQNRLIPDVIYVDWLITRREQYAGNKVMNGMSFQDCWNARFATRYAGRPFGKFMSAILSGSPAPNKPVSSADYVWAVMKKHRRGPWPFAQAGSMLRQTPP